MKLGVEVELAGLQELTSSAVRMFEDGHAGVTLPRLC
jgi:hypothetical protein